MQPYFFPYIGYFQLIKTVDAFVIYDDVNYIKQGWINRNRILLNNNAHFITLELTGASSFKKINEVEVGKNKNKIIKTLELVYKKATYYKEIFPLIEEILNYEENNLSKFLTNSLLKLNQKLNITTNILVSSNIEKNNELKGYEKVLELCKLLKAKTYVNAIGGADLYSKDVFLQHGVELKFIKTSPINYTQFSNEFIPWLSIIDMLMFNSTEDISKMLDKYELI